MKSLRLRFLRCLSFALASPAVAFSEGTHRWEPKKIGGEDYLPVEQISRFYGLDDPKRDRKQVATETPKVKLVFEIGSSTCKINGIKFIFDKPVREVDAVPYVWQSDLSLVLDPVLRPNSIEAAVYFKTVILDPAHGGKDRGAVSRLGSADEYALNVAKLAAKQLQARGYGVVLTRDENVDVPLQERLDRIHAVEGSAIFISIDFSSGPGDKRGLETMPSAATPPGSRKEGIESSGYGSASMALATSVHGSGVRCLGENTADLGVRQTRSSVFSQIKHPAIEIKGGYLSHEIEARLIDTDAYQDALATGISKGVGKYRQAVTREPSKP